MSAIETSPLHAAREAEMEAFFAAMTQVNPFLSNRVNAPDGRETDVEAIHGKEFRQLQAAARVVREESCGLGVVVLGEAGVGKSNMLARFCRWARRERTGHVVFLHNLQARPERLARYVLKCVVASLAEGPAATRTPLYRLVQQAVLAAVPAATERPRSTEVRRSFLRMTDEFTAANANAGADAPRVYEMLFDYYLAVNQAAHFRADQAPADWLVRWISGEDLSDDEAGRLARLTGLPQAWLARIEDNQAIKTVLLALARLLAVQGQSLFLCFDQIDNLSAEQIQALAQFLHPLIDHGQNLLVVSASVKGKLLEYVASGAVLQAGWDRMAQDEVSLQRIGLNEARMLVAGRIEAFLEPFVGLPAVRQTLERDTLFPLSEQWLREEFGDKLELRPRDVLRAARRAWQTEQARLADLGGLAWLASWPNRLADAGSSSTPVAAAPLPPLAERVDRRVSEYLEAQVAQRLAHPAELPSDAEHLRGLVERLMRWAAAGGGIVRQVVAVDQDLSAHRRPTYNLVIVQALADGTQRRVAVRFPGGETSNAAAVSLRRIVQDEPGYDQALVVVDARQPLRLGDTGKDYLRQLEARGPDRFQLVELTLSDYAMLDAMVSAVTSAADLDLEQPDGSARRLEPDEVKTSFARLGCYGAHPLLKILAGK